ncbi:hypothetical protein QTP86_020941 [Hemibagrus guttatus]|nr:hypothetical protein QTP86_020941 [Hemibagrus guttatus]
MRIRFQAPDAFSGDEDDDNDAIHRATLNTTSHESRLNRVKSRFQRFSSPVQRYWRSQWPARICSMLCCLVVVSFIAILCSLLYVILKDLRAERVTTEDGTEVRLLGFWSMLVLSFLAGVLCCSFSWTLTYFDSFEPGMFPPTPLSPAKFSSGCMFRVIVLKVSLCPSLKSFTDSNRFSSMIALYLAPSFFPSAQTSFPVPAEEKHPHNLMLPPPCFTMGMANDWPLLSYGLQHGYTQWHCGWTHFLLVSYLRPTHSSHHLDLDWLIVPQQT